MTDHLQSAHRSAYRSSTSSICGSQVKIRIRRDFSPHARGLLVPRNGNAHPANGVARESQSTGESVDVEVLRAGKRLTLSVPVQPLRRLVPAVVYDEPQPYFVYGGFAFVGLTEPYLQEWGDDWMADAPQDLVNV